ncbi:TonB-dependent receptor plug domain-containing protein [Nonlabens spongiae]|uniref:TonB-dependent receptor plug domain-containing protein n=1 Tax=Nonlabens spongiae TaxID=331648 RepID=UPI001FE31017|nr:TonB-dependent receptor [Nonlabens spongiae]
MQIPPLDLAQFEIIKGSSSTLYGGGAIAGLVNMQSKRPQREAELDLMLVGTQASGATVNTFYSKRNDRWGTTLFASGNLQKAYDPDDNGFSNLPETKTITVNPRLFYYPSNRTTFWLGLNGTFDDRLGGSIEAIDNDANTYKEHNISRRLSSQASFRTSFSDRSSLEVKNSINHFDRDLHTRNYQFTGTQINSFTEASYTLSTNRTDWVFGTNLYTSSFDEQDTQSPRDQNDTTIGAFINNVHDLNEHFILETGFRTDYAVDWGVFALPRVSLLYKSDGAFTSRLGGGLGYKIPDIFTEDAERVNFQNVLGIDKNQLEAETSYGVNLDFDYKFSLGGRTTLSINQLFYLTAIENGLTLNSTDNGFLEYRNAPDLTMSRGAETNVKIKFGDFKWFLNYAFIDTQLNYLDGNPQIPLTARHSAGNIVMYETPEWRLGFESYYWGKQLLFNGTESEDFITLGFLAMRNFEWGGLYINFENFTDRRQDRFSPVVEGTLTNPQFNELYAPNDGFIFSAGIIWKPFGNEMEHHDD